MNVCVNATCAQFDRRNCSGIVAVWRRVTGVSVTKKWLVVSELMITQSLMLFLSIFNVDRS